MAKFYSSLDEIKREIQSGEVTVEGLVKDYLARIRSNAHLNAFNEVFEEEALSRSKTIDQRIKAGSAGRLAGMVMLNLYDTAGAVDNQDFPTISKRRDPLDPRTAFGGTLRQSQIGLDAFGPDIAGAHTSANVKFDFAEFQFSSLTTDATCGKSAHPLRKLYFNKCKREILPSHAKESDRLRQRASFTGA